MVKGEKDKVYVRYSSLFNALMAKKRPQVEEILFLATYQYADFERLFDTDITASVGEKGISASFVMGVTKHNLHLSKRAKGILKKGKDNAHFAKLQVSLCKKYDILFWYCHASEAKIEKPMELVLSAKKLISLWEKNGIEYAIAAEIQAERRKKTNDRIFKIIRPAGAGVSPAGIPFPSLNILFPKDNKE